MEMTDTERRAMNFLLCGDNETLAILRAQLATSSVVRRQLTGHGFFTHFHVSEAADKLPSPGRFVIEDVHATFAEIEYPVGFILFVEDGAIDTLEGFAYGDDWPDTATITRFYYVRPVPSSPEGGLSVLEETAERDFQWEHPRPA